MNNHELWKDLVGCHLTFEYLDVDHQALKVSSLKQEVFLSSHEGGFWFHDALTISRDPPRSPVS
jgi:hypothetical protein